MMANKRDSMALVTAKAVKKSFKRGDRQDLLVLNDVNVMLYPGEIVAILGKTGAGKSTLLRILAGLAAPTEGEVRCRGQLVTGPVPGLSMVFQQFALMPWLTVLQNVELGLEALGVDRQTRRERALKAIDVVGMDGFESAYPKELSGGMAQRVGLARALVVEPDVLLMDEPFSSLDVLTAENLRNDLLDLWLDKKTNIHSMLMVTHNIEEAILLADRILIFDANPGTIRAELSCKIPHPRQEHDTKIRQLVDEIYQKLSNLGAESQQRAGARFKNIGLNYRLPKVEVSELSGLLEALNGPEYEAKVDLSELAEELHLEVNELFALTEVLEILRFVRVADSDIELTYAGKNFAEADILDQKKIFATQLLNHVPLARHVRRVLDERPEHRAHQSRFLEELQDSLSEDAAEEVLKVVIEWGRFAELFAYNFNSGQLSLEDPE